MSKAVKTVLVLRTCAADMVSKNGFVWPKTGHVEAPDWRDNYACGGGLHGWLWGEGDGSLGSDAPDAMWLVVRVAEDDIRHGKDELIGKCKFRAGVVEFCGDRKGATDYIVANGATGKSVIGYTATAGNRGTATAGNRGTATAGYAGTATAGNRGTATAGDAGTATAGDAGTATAGDAGTATAGEKGMIAIRYWHEASERYRIAVGYVGEDGIEPGKRYHLDDAHKFVEVPS